MRIEMSSDIVINQTELFKTWLASLSDERAKAKIIIRIKRVSAGNFGDYKSLGDGVSELRIDVGKGYRVYYARQDKIVYLLLSGGDKSTQSKDIKAAKKMWEAIKKGEKL